MFPVSPVPVVERTLPAMFAAACGRDRRRRLFVCGTVAWSVEQAQKAAIQAAVWLESLGVRRGDRVAIVCSNRAEFAQLVLGCGWMGAIAVPVNTACRAPQLSYYLSDSQARLLVIEESLIAEMAEVKTDGLHLQSVVIIEGDPFALTAPSDAASAEQIQVRARAREQIANRWPLHSFQQSNPHNPVGADSVMNDAATIHPGDPWLILYTSGTTGPSKGVLCPHGQLYAWGINAANMLGINPGDVLCTTLPFFHVNALSSIVQALVADATMVLEPRFSVSGFWQTMARHSTTVGYVLGAMVPMLLAREPSEEERSHTMRVALGPGVPPALARVFEDRTGVRLLEGYGSTETNFVIAALPNTQCEGTMGLVQPGFDARVVDEHDAELPAGVPGELVLRAHEPFAFSAGYFNRAEQTVQAWRNLWFHTGDRVVRDEAGRFIFLDRMKDAIRRRGENISSFEVEQVLLSHPALANAAVFPVRSELAEDEVMTALVVKPGATLDRAELVQFCAARMPYFAVPRYIDIVDDLPRTENGKVRKVVLRERGISDQTWDRETAGIVVQRHHRSRG